MIETGQSAPDFTLPRDGGETLTLSAQKPRNVVLYFYPRADTSGCTKQAAGFTAHLDAFAAANTVVIGVSKDPVKKLDKFRDKHGLSVALVSDEESTVCEDWGVWVEKQMYGKTYMGIERATFLIDGTGTVRNIWRKVKVPGHVEEVLEAVKAL
ncbi:alkyl hydroperoxide reductase/ Thiol specific antioxidant/ Mal allergen [Dinoroseobacter shibae DFL 12 = DSM 16493]|jgi:peroxiredoxin Q/BCP|uniref:thioredoxin-dependent peroxiredoxin n=1 Tax=Dinoroseobacter shibae (strain DSM 16493 / NCIMB 14021 / DFL 12) TaxID=398580 RepID=A8LHX3_DINSH|nr:MULTISPECIES: thioredoxin-dependent thiol peroxidase [Dinoroseobacter]ABV92920.1 alkyl hydroperoxide reductase/ Thiol specific antioxidant/ Mal allergen [Dinoroseobacter shibae DFL 12 = DSM 16493]MDD9716020.1 thioredoxin-dependent thiol peroxidase [Dinoroseobacter sp. PD6]URF47856.1 thioredoxin-dependent thiol peroxidase [Dinoroseobacter shibae]URF52165.1 thioredoxin-dependent thiol peroxidase [Dinoroseobacter shibae]